MSMQPLFGRDREITILDDLLDRVTERGGALVLRGEAGIGKSSLLATARMHAQAHAMRVLTSIGMESEANLPFAGLHQLLKPILAGVEELPAPQREALLAALGMSDRAAPDLFLIALASLDLLAGAAGDAPLLLIAEDAQWLDRSTCDVLAFVARRLESEPMILLIAVREGVESPLLEAGLPEMRLYGLDEAASSALLDARAPDLALDVRERLLDEAAGNPLALLELPAALLSEQRGGKARLPPVLLLTTRLERAFLARLAGLPPTTRTVLLVAAVNDGRDLTEVLHAAAVIEDRELGDGELMPAVSAGLVELNGTGLHFRHPLVRSAIYQAASLAQQHAAHAALARVLSDQPDRSVWHRAASIIGPDESVATELEAAAARARRRGAIATAVAALERAAQLTDDPIRRGDHLLRATELAFLYLGRRDIVGRLLRAVEQLELGPQERTRLSWLREVFEVQDVWSGAARVRSFVEIADRARLEGDTDLALNSLLTVALRCWWSNPDQETRNLVVAAAERITVPDDNPALLAILAFAAPIERGASVIELIARLNPDELADPSATLLLGVAATGVGAFDLSAGFLTVAVAGLRAHGRLVLLAQVLVSQALAACFLGTWAVAMPATEEAVRLARETEQPRWAAAAQLVQAMVAAQRGELDVAESLAAEAESVLLPMGANPMLALVQLARGVAALGAGRYAEANQQLRRIFDPLDIAYHPYVRSWAIGEIAEAAMYSGHQEEARALAAELEPLAVATQSPLLQAGLSYARPLLGDDEQAEELFQAGLSADLTRWPFFRARLLLAYGAWLRRQRRVAESRAPLRAAREAFDALGAVPWGERARQELRASGETSRKRTPGAWDQLSPQELQIAQMAAEGLSNREIGQRLYLSHRTVGSHLYRIFPKLGVTSRSELRTLPGL